MSLRKKIFKGGLNVGIGQLVTQASSFLRNIIIARILSPSDFGIAAMFAVTLSLWGMISNFAVDKLIIQSEQGNQEDFQATVQFVQLVRGCIGGLVLFIIAKPVAGLFGVPQAAWAFRWLAFLPVISGLANLDFNRMQREMKFRPMVIKDISTSVLITLIAYPLGIYFGDYSAMLWLVVLQTGVDTVISHLVSERRYRVGLHKAYAGQIFTFGWPLLINGILMFGILQGDRFIIGSANQIFGREIYSLEQLGIYSVAFSLTIAPTMFIAGISAALLLPVFSSLQKEPEKFLDSYKLSNQLIVAVAAFITIPMIMSGEWLVRTIYGSKYAIGLGVIGWLSAMQAMRIFRIGPTLAAMSKGDTKNAMYSNTIRSVALIGGLASAYVSADTSWIAFSGFVGEMLALAVCLGRLRMKHNIPISGCVSPVAVSLGFMGIGTAVMHVLRVDGRSISSLIFTSSVLIMFVITFMFVFKKLRSEIMNYDRYVTRAV